jgi:Arc/MetJ-type ribon-helix-helix transcriptional regulator
MATSKIAITIDENVLRQLDSLVKSNLFSNRSQLVREAIAEKLMRIGKQKRFIRECSKLDPEAERRMAEEGFESEISEWPEY